MKVMVEIDIPDSVITDNLTAAFEGGSNYWIDKVGIEILGIGDYASEMVMTGGTLTIHTEDGSIYALNGTLAKSGVIAMQRLYPEHFANFYKENGDATTADIFLQCCLFGEAIYG